LGIALHFTFLVDFVLLWVKNIVIYKFIQILLVIISIYLVRG